MGEESTAQVEAQPQSETRPQPQPQPQPHDTIDTTTIAEPSPTELTNAPTLTSSPPSKIPFRPRKIRKLSPDSSDPNSSQHQQQQQIVPGASAAPERPKSRLAARKASKNVPSRAAVAPPPRSIARSLRCEGEVEVALRHLRNVDPILAPVIDSQKAPTFENFHSPFLALTRSILYQQLAYKAGTSIYTRFIQLLGGESCVDPDTILAQTPVQLRQIGISGRKASYLHDLARKYKNGILSDAAIYKMDDKSLFTMLTMVNGIGSWSVHMFMIFSLHRPDVLPVNDLGVRKGIQMLYQLAEMPRPSQMEQLCEKWRPYRSVACWYLWRLLETNGASASATAAAVAAGTTMQITQQQQEQQQQQQQQQQPQHQQQQQQLMDSLSSLINIGTWGP